MPGKHRRPPDGQATYGEVFAVREFRALWSAQGLSLIGDQLAQVALAALVYARTGSPLLTALAFALTYLVPIVGGPLLAGLADIFPRRRVLIVCDLLRAGLVGTMALPGVPFWALFALVFLTVLVSAPFSAARAALLPDILAGDAYVLGSAVGNMTFQAGQVLGFVAGSGVVLWLGTQRALLIDALTFVVSAVILAIGVRPRPAARSDPGPRPSLWRITSDGARLVFGDPVLRSLVLFAWLAGFYVLPEGLVAPYAAELGGGPGTMGILFASMPAGAVIGAYVFSRLVAPPDRIRMLGWLAMMSCAPLIGCALGPPLWVIVLLWAASGAASAYQLAANAAFMTTVPPSGRALAFGLAQSGLLAAQGLGIVTGGAAAQRFGPEPVIGAAAAIGLGAASLLALNWARIRATVLEEPPEDEAPPSAAPVTPTA